MSTRTHDAGTAIARVVGAQELDHRARTPVIHAPEAASLGKVSGAGDDARSRTAWLLAYNGFSARYLLHTGLVEHLLEHPGTRLVILVRTKSVEDVAARFPDPRIAVRPFAYEAIRAHFGAKRWRGRLAQIRLLVLDHRAPHETANIWYRKFFRRYASRSLLHRLSQAYLRGAVFALRRSRLLRRVMRRLDAIDAKGAAFHDALFEELPPDVVIVPSLGYFLADAYLIREARRRAVRTVGVMTNWDHTTSKGTSAATPDVGIVWGERSAEEARVHHDMAASQVEIVGPAHYDHYYRRETFLDRGEFLRSLKLDSSRKTVLLAAMSPRPYPWNAPILEILAKAAAEGTLGAPAQILFRLHPNHLALRNENFERWRAEMVAIDDIVARYGTVVVQSPLWSDASDSFALEKDDAVHLANSILHSDVVVTVFSTLNLEAAILDRPLVNCAIYGHDRELGPEDRSVLTITHLRSIFDCRNSWIAITPQELIESVAAYIADPSKDREERRRFVHTELGPGRGSSADRLAAAVLKYSP